MFLGLINAKGLITFITIQMLMLIQRHEFLKWSDRSKFFIATACHQSAVKALSPSVLSLYTGSAAGAQLKQQSALCSLSAPGTRGEISVCTTAHEAGAREVKSPPAVSVAKLQREQSKYSKHAVSIHMTRCQQIITEPRGI